jgi:hypothetical protein
MRTIVIAATGLACFLLGGCSGFTSVEVMDDFTGIPVVGAKIGYTVTGSDAQKTIATTDLEGEALVIIPRNADNLVVSKNGYRPLTVPVQGIEPREMEMGMKLRMAPISASPVNDRAKEEWPKWN